MAYSVCGSETGSMTAPRRSSSPTAARTAASTPGCMPSTKYSFGSPRRRPRTPLPRAAREGGTRRGEEGAAGAGGGGVAVGGRRARRGGRVGGVVAGDRLEHGRGVADVAGEGADLIERRGGGDHPAARHAPVPRLAAG